MKNIFTKIASLIIVIVLLLAGYYYITLTREAPEEAAPDLPTRVIIEARETVTRRGPDSPDLLDNFNIFSELKSEEALENKYEELITVSRPRILDRNFAEIISFVDRTGLPFNSEEDLANFGKVTAYLLAEQDSPMDFAKENGMIPNNAREDGLMSRADYVAMVSELFMRGAQDPVAILAGLGFIDDEELWRDTDRREGWLLMEAISLALDIRNLVEQRRIKSSKEDYAEALVEFPKTALELSDASLELILRALELEFDNTYPTANFDFGVTEDLKTEFAADYGNDLDTELIQKIRLSFYDETGQRAPDIYQLASRVNLGDCFNELFRKTYLGPMARTGNRGTTFVCGKVEIFIPENSYIINAFSFPDLEEVNKAGFRTETIFSTNVMRSLKNTFVIGESGEKRLTISYTPEAADRYLDAQFGLFMKDREGEVIFSLNKPYVDSVAELKFHPRLVDGDNLIYFDPLLDTDAQASISSYAAAQIAQAQGVDASCTVDVASVNDCVSTCLEVEKCTTCSDGQVFDCEPVSAEECNAVCGRTVDGVEVEEGSIAPSLDELGDIEIFC